MLLHGEAAAQCVLGQAVHRDGAQMVFFKLQECDGTATEMGAKAGNQTLKPDGGRQVGDQVRKQEILHGVNSTVAR